MNLDDFAQAVGERGEPGLVFGRVGEVAGLLAEAILLIDQGDEGLVIERRVVALIPFDADRLAGFPAQGQVGAEEGQQGSGALRGAIGEEFDGVGAGALGGAPGRFESLGQADDLRRGSFVPGSTEGDRAHRLSPPSCPGSRPGV